MAKLIALWNTFRSNIEPDTEAVNYAQDAHKPVRDFLKDDEEFGEYFVGSFLYGSYKRYTAVGDIKDVDIVVLTNFDPDDEENSPQKVLRKLKDALARYYDDPENPQYQRRSIRVDDPLPDNEDVEMTLDIIPAVAIDGEDDPLKVPDREVEDWIWSHPKGHLDHTTKLNREEYSGQRYVPLVKIMKWWWGHQCELRQPETERPKPKGFWVECLTSESFDPKQKDWAEHFIAVLENISEEYTGVEEVPELTDPGLDNETIKTNMTLEEFEMFMTAADESLELAIAARDTDDKLKSSELWRKIFGDKFPLYGEGAIEEGSTNSYKVALGSTVHVEPLRWSSDRRYQVRIDAHIYKELKKLGGINSNGRTLSSGLRLKYVAKTNVPGDYDVYWQVVNTGRHAAQAGQLRGKIFRANHSNDTSPTNPCVHWEHTEYTGKHWIECFIVRNGICVARSQRFYVNIKNPEF